MLNVILFDSDARNHLLPLTATRPMGELRIGVLTLREKWERRLKASVSYITQEYLQEKFPMNIEDDNLIIHGGVIPNDALCQKIKALEANQALLFNGELIAARLNEAQFEALIEDEEVRELDGIDIDENIPLQFIERSWDLIRLNPEALTEDIADLTAGRESQELPESNRVIGDHPVFLESGVRIECCIINATDGPVYFGKNAVIMEGSMLRGPLAIGAESMVKMGAKIYGPTSIGPGCRIGGEVARCLIFGNSNKSHEGYLGDSVLGEWCNLGADTNNSNLKNNYSEVKLWNYETNRFEKTGQQFFGLVMGDHAKCGINTMFNTGTVVGVFANVFGAGYPRNFIPDFSWGGSDTALRTYAFADACETAERVMQRRGIAFNELEKAVLYHIYDRTATFRTWEK